MKHTITTHCRWCCIIYKDRNNETIRYTTTASMVSSIIDLYIKEHFIKKLMAVFPFDYKDKYGRGKEKTIITIN